MNLRFFFFSILLLAAIGLSTTSAVAFERQKFDRSRFERPDPSARPPLPGTATTSSSTPAPAEPFTPATSTPMDTEKPATPTYTGGSEFSSSSTNTTSTWGASAPATTPANAPTAIFSATSVPSAYPPPSPYPAGITPEEKAVIDAPLFDQLPVKDFNNAKDHDELVALQKKTGACMIVYFKNLTVPNEKGLCNWFEKTVTTDIKWRKAMKFYLMLEINLPGNSVVEELTTKYRAGKTPAIFVVKPGSTMGTRLKLFDYPAGSRPVPIEAAVVLESLKAASTPAYQTLF